jgi:hypothetical protein
MSKFNIGDRVRHTTVSVGTGVVVDDALNDGGEVPVKWDNGRGILGAFPTNLEPVETTLSDALKDSQAEVDRLTARVLQLRNDLAEQEETSRLHESTATDALAEVRRLEGAWKRADGLLHELDRANERVEEFRARNDRLLGQNKYIRAMLSPTQEARALGFADGLLGKSIPTSA